MHTRGGYSIGAHELFLFYWIPIGALGYSIGAPPRIVIRMIDEDDDVILRIIAICYLNIVFTVATEKTIM